MKKNSANKTTGNFQVDTGPPLPGLSRKESNFEFEPGERARTTFSSMVERVAELEYSISDSGFRQDIIFNFSDLKLDSILGLHYFIHLYEYSTEFG